MSISSSQIAALHHARQLWFMKSVTHILKQDRLLWIGIFMWCMMEKWTPHSTHLMMKWCCIAVDMWIHGIQWWCSHVNQYGDIILCYCLCVVSYRCFKGPFFFWDHKFTQICMCGFQIRISFCLWKLILTWIWCLMFPCYL